MILSKTLIFARTRITDQSKANQTIWGFSIITLVIIEILAPSLAENGVIFRYNHHWRGDYSGGQILKMAVSSFVDVSDLEMVS